MTMMRGVAHDITDRKRVQEALRVANRKLNLLSSISWHDIDNQLTIIRDYTALLGKDQRDPAVNERLRKVTAAAERIAAMIQFTREYETIGVKGPVWQDCWQLVETAANQAPLGQVEVLNDLSTGTVIFADPLIIKVFYNLIDNAARYSGKTTTIRFSGEEHDGSYLIVGEDDGVGVAADEKERIFERGYGKNTGLGLFLALEILSITGITIRETGEPGKGARFAITVPQGAW